MRRERLLRTSEAVLTDDLDVLLEAGASANVGLVDDHGRPVAARGFGLHVRDRAPLRVDVLLAVGVLEDLDRGPGADPFAAAVTVSSIALFRSLQLKGTAHDVRVATDEEHGHARRALTAMFAAVHRYDGHSLALVPVVLPERLLAFTVDVTEAYDQTPGPGAGRPLELA